MNDVKSTLIEFSVYENGPNDQIFYDMVFRIRSQCLRTIFTMKPPSPPAIEFWNEGNAHLESGHLDKAVRSLTNAILSNRDNIGLYKLRAVARSAKQDFKGAIADYTCVLDVTPDDADSYLSRGVIYLESNDLDKAIKDFIKAIEVKPEYPQAYGLMGEVYSLKNDLDKAIQNFKRMNDLDPSFHMLVDTCDSRIRFKQREEHIPSFEDSTGGPESTSETWPNVRVLKKPSATSDNGSIIPRVVSDPAKNIGEIGLSTTEGINEAIWKRSCEIVKQYNGRKDIYKQHFGFVTAGCPPMDKIIKIIEKIAVHEVPVLITGESGTGKEVIARAIHFNGPRRDKQFIAVNCPSLAKFLETELFGHEKGAFTDANKMRQGRFEVADGGTILLDEITEIDPATQAKLLRVLQEKTFERVGSNTTLYADVRILSTSNRDLEQALKEGKLREDIYFRLNCIEIRVPPLRERREDIPVLCEHFLQHVAQKSNMTKKSVNDAALKMLCSYDWPGNVRRLEKIVERVYALYDQEGVITEKVLLDVEPDFARCLNLNVSIISHDPPGQEINMTSTPVMGYPKQRMLRKNKTRVIEVLAQHGGKVTSAAKELGVTKWDLYEFRKWLRRNFAADDAKSR